MCLRVGGEVSGGVDEEVGVAVDAEADVAVCGYWCDDSVGDGLAA